MIRTTCPKCGREDAVADYLASLPIMCNGCGTRVTVGEPIVTRPALPPPVAPPPPPPSAAVAAPPPPPPKAVVPPPPPPPPPKQKAPKPVPPPPPPKQKPVPPPSPPLPSLDTGPLPIPDELVMTLDETGPELLAPDQPAPAPPVAKRPQQFPASLERPFPLPLAPVWRRILARFLMLLGLAMMAGLGFAVLMFVPNAVKRDPYITYAIIAAFPVIYLLVNAAMLARTGQDVGKRYAGIRIVGADGTKATQMAALLKRDALTLVLGLTGIGLIYWLVSAVLLFSKGGRTLHDRVAGTRVVRDGAVAPPPAVSPVPVNTLVPPPVASAQILTPPLPPRNVAPPPPHSGESGGVRRAELVDGVSVGRPKRARSPMPPWDFWLIVRRIGARLWVVLASFVSLVTGYALAAGGVWMGLREPFVFLLLMFLPFLLYQFWNVVQLAGSGQDRGKKLFRLRVLKTDGNPAGFASGVFVRHWLSILLYGTAGLLAMLGTVIATQTGGTHTPEQQAYSVGPESDRPISAKVQLFGAGEVTGVGGILILVARGIGVGVILYWLADFILFLLPGHRSLHDRLARTEVVRA